MKESTIADYFIRKTACSTAKISVDERGLIVFDCQKIAFGSRKRCSCFLLNCSAVVDFIFRPGLPPIRCETAGILYE